MRDEPNPIYRILQDRAGHPFAVSPVIQEIVACCHAIRVNVEGLRLPCRVWQAQHTVIKRLFVEQFLPNDGCQPPPKPKLERTGEDKPTAIKPTAAIVFDKRFKNPFRVSKSVERIVHEQALLFGASRWLEGVGRRNQDTSGDISQSTTRCRIRPTRAPRLRQCAT